MITLREKQYGKQFCSFDPITMSILGGGAANIGGSLFGGLFGSSAEKKRAAAIREAGQVGATSINKTVKRANTRAQEGLDMARGDLSPFREFGVQAGTTLTDLLLGGGNARNLLQSSDLFNFQSEIGSRNINRELAARGLYGSGAGLETLARFNNQLVAEEGQRLTDRLFSLTGLGATSAGNMANLTEGNSRYQAGNIYQGGVEAANMIYNSTVGAANATANGNRMLADMGQNIFQGVGQGLQQYGNFMLNKPILNSLITSNGGITSDDYSLASKHGISPY